MSKKTQEDPNQLAERILSQLDTVVCLKPREECLVYWVGEDYRRKSAFVDDLAIRLLEQSEDVIVFLHTVEDPLRARIARIKGDKYGYPSKYFKRAGYYLKNLATLPPRYSMFDDINREAAAWISSLVDSERLILADIAALPPQLPAVEMWIRAIRTKFPNKSLVVVGDYFHLYDLPGYEASEAKAGEMHSFMKRLTTQYRCKILMPVHLSSPWSCPVDRPRMARAVEGL